MIIFKYFILVSWLIFLVYWLVSAIGVKRNLKGQSLWQSLGLRLGVIILLLIFARNTSFGHVFHTEFAHYFQNMRNNKTTTLNFILASFGVVLVTLGITCAIWARMHLGRNWGMPMSIKEKPDLITSGPYTYIRHPIYTGMLTAMLGSACVDGPFWLIPLIVSGVYFLYSIQEEEKLMIKQFPNQYQKYKKRTKALIPFIY